MASLVLTVVGTAVAGPFGGLVGGLIGSYLDQAFIFPAIFGRPSGPRLEDLHVQTAAEGSNGRLVLGPRNRTAGTLIWASDFIEHENSDKKGPTLYTYSVHAAIAIGEGEIRRVRRIWADSKVIYDRGEQDGRVGDIRVYTGTLTQTVDPLIEASDPGNTPAYRGTAYVVIENLDVTDWGNRIPNFSFEVEGDIELPVQDAIIRIGERGGIDAAEMDTTRVPGCLRGYVVLGPQETIRILDPLMTAFSLGARDDNGVLTFWKRGEEDNYGVVPAEDLGAAEYGQEAAARVVKITDTREFQLPSQVTVQHVDPAWDLQQGSQRERRINATNPDVVSLTLPITLKVEEARDLAKVLLWAGYAERQLVEFDLPPSYIRLQEGDVLTVPITADGLTALVRVIEIGRGYNYLLRVKGHITELGTYDQTSSVDNRSGSGTVTPPTALTWYILDIPAITSNHQQVLGFYVAAGFRRLDTTWRGTRAYKSADNVDFEDAWTHQRESTFGKTISVLQDIGASSLWWDNANTVDVLLYEGTLASASEASVLNGANRVIIGNEIIGFTTATLIADRTYRLSGLLRGLRNTEDYMAGHAIDERVVYLSASLVFYTGVEQADIGSDRYYKNVPVGANAATAPVQTHAPLAGTIRHFAPAHLQAVNSQSTSNNDCEISWVRRSRALVAPFSIGDAPLLDSTELYDLEIRYAQGTPLRTERIVADTSFTYTEAMQTADGLTPGTDGFHVYVYQVSTVAGRSLPAITFYDPTP